MYLPPRKSRPARLPLVWVNPSPSKTWPLPFPDCFTTAANSAQLPWLFGLQTPTSRFHDTSLAIGVSPCFNFAPFFSFVYFSSLPLSFRPFYSTNSLFFSDVTGPGCLQPKRERNERPSAKVSAETSGPRPKMLSSNRERRCRCQAQQQRAQLSSVLRHKP